jgi:hypothetical protein
MGCIRRSWNITIAVTLLLIVGATMSAVESLAAYDAARISRFVNDDTFFAAQFDLAALAKTAGDDDSAIFAALPLLGDDTAAVMLTLHGLDQLAREIHKVGVDSIYAVAGLEDANEQGSPLLIFQVRQGASAKDVVVKVKSLMVPLSPPGWTLETREAGENSVLVGRTATLDRYSKLASSDRDDLISPLSKLSGDGAVLAAVFCPGPDFRRVVRELWPELPGGLATLTGELADKWRHLEVGVGGSPDAGPRVAMVASDAASAELFATLWRKLPEAMATFGGHDDFPKDVRERIQTFVDALPPNVESSRVTLRFPDEETKLSNLRALAEKAIDVSMQSSRRNKRLQRFRELAIALLNHEGATKLLPAAAIRDKDGKPLLSWRVKILPFLGDSGGRLYKEFHLDEPWDSLHNRTLIEKMPEVYADPDPKLNELSRAGKTTYQVPVAPETIFYSSEGTTIRDITDGTSRTIAIVEVSPARAVEWTKPDDWEVNVQEPLEGVARDDRSVFMAAFADGHIEAIPVNVDFKKLRGLLTRDGGELFDWP